jgi:hypothetical protein
MYIIFMKVHFYNYAHNGDHFLVQPIVRNLCLNNPDIDFTLYCNYNTYIYSNIPNLKIYIAALYPPPTDCTFFRKVDDNTIAFNLWIGALLFGFYQKHVNSNTTLHDIECSMAEYMNIFRHLLEYVKNTYNISLNFEKYSEDKYLPIIPECNISLFHEWNKNRTNTKKLIFYYNYQRRSGQILPFYEHDDFIINIAEQCPQYIFILPMFTQRLDDYVKSKPEGDVNIINCEKMFNCIETISCENLCKIQKICNQCDYSIHYDIGPCLYYVNNETPTSKNIPIHVTAFPLYSKNILADCPKIRTKTIVVEAHNPHEANTKLREILNK